MSQVSSFPFLWSCSQLTPACIHTREAFTADLTMEPVKCALLLFLFAFAQIVCALGSPFSSEDDGDMWTEHTWQGYPIERGVTIRLSDLIKRSKSQQFHGLMGRSSGARQPVRLGRKRNNNNNNKGEMFVGLMGRRSSGGGVEEEWNSDSY